MDRYDSLTSHKENHHVQTEKSRPCVQSESCPCGPFGRETIAQLSAEHGVHQTLISKWLKQLKSEAVDIFSGAKTSKDVNAEKQLQQLTLWAERILFAQTMDDVFAAK
ncbi:hypothetical protein MASR1M90_08760 [Desulfovibrionales bacterium]